jgi:L-lactate dehydrogenase complex protein LldG
LSGREAILNKVRAALGSGGGDAARKAAIAQRLAKAPKGVIPARGQLDDKARLALFCGMAEKASASIARVKSPDDVPKAVANYLRQKNLAPQIRMGGDRRLSRMPWAAQRNLEVRPGPSDGDDEVGVSHALGGVAETGTLVLASGADNPTTINFLPEHHIVVVEAKDVSGDLETVLARVRKSYGKGNMPRTLNLITGPSRSGDIEQKIILGAHGPRALHIIVAGG